MLTPGIDPYDWYEVWVDWSSPDFKAHPPVLAVLLGNKELTRFQAFSPTDGRLWFTAGTYQEACFALQEDEYALISSRIADGDI